MNETSNFLNIDEFKNSMRHMISNNQYLQENNKPPVAVEVVGDSGLGKTSSILQVGEELGLPVAKLNLAQIEELGDLVGFPIRQFQVCKDAETSDVFTEYKEDPCTWIDEHAVEEYRKLGYTFTGKNRMSYCPPEWIADRAEGGILLLDDWTRADQRFVQAVMELIDRQQYISWKLPKNWHIVLSANPDNGEYMVNSTDDAQKTRYISFNLKWDLDVWARWAETQQIDTRCINFLLKHPELVTTKTNPRSITTFFNSISSLKDFESNLPLIQIIGEGSVGTEFASFFTTFINNRLDKLMSPKEILFGKEDDILHRLQVSIGKDSKYRADIAAVLATRIANYSVFYAETNSVDKAMITRIQRIVTTDIFTNDLRYSIVRNIFNGNKQKFRDLMLEPKVAKYILG
jgi:MoxR-like ATPase